MDAFCQRAVVADEAVHHQQQHVERDSHQQPDVELLASRRVRLEDDGIYLFFRHPFPLSGEQYAERQPMQETVRHIDKPLPHLAVRQPGDLPPYGPYKTSLMFLFRFLFQTDKFGGKDIETLLSDPGLSGILEVIAGGLKMNTEQAKSGRTLI